MPPYAFRLLPAIACLRAAAERMPCQLFATFRHCRCALPSMPLFTAQLPRASAIYARCRLLPHMPVYAAIPRHMLLLLRHADDMSYIRYFPSRLFMPDALYAATRATPERERYLFVAL